MIVEARLLPCGHFPIPSAPIFSRPGGRVSKQLGKQPAAGAGCRQGCRHMTASQHMTDPWNYWKLLTESRGLASSIVWEQDSSSMVESYPCTFSCKQEQTLFMAPVEIACTCALPMLANDSRLPSLRFTAWICTIENYELSSLFVGILCSKNKRSILWSPKEK